MTLAQLPGPGDTFTLGHADGFGVVLSTNPKRGVCLVQLQNRDVGEISVAIATDLIARFRSWVEGQQ